MGKSPTSFKKGNKANPNGRPPVLLPEVQRAIDANRNAMKVLILSKLEGKVSEWVENIITAGIADGDIIRFKMLIEIALGKMVTESSEFEVSDEEKLLVLEFRRRKKESLERIVSK
jgi:hypothetical protein